MSTTNTVYPIQIIVYIAVTIYCCAKNIFRSMTMREEPRVYTKLLCYQVIEEARKHYVKDAF